jgi:Calcineurin-like phosphoesterase
LTRVPRSAAIKITMLKRRRFLIATRGRRIPLTPRDEDEVLDELKATLKRIQVLEAMKVSTDRAPRRTGAPESDFGKPAQAAKSVLKPAPWRWKAAAGLVVGLLIAMAAGWILYHPGPADLFEPIGPRWKDESATHFTFAAAGDFGGPDNPDAVGLVQRARAAGMSFLVALGDLGYAANEAGWCGAMKRYVPELVIIAGAHDDVATEGGSMSEYVANCPYPLSSPVVPGNETPGYGYEYYFDYPRKTPLARFILLSAGLSGRISYNYSDESLHTEWVEDAIAQARAEGIPWVIVGVHKQCLTVGKHDHCSMGQEVFHELVEAKVDLILTSHDHVYERSKQLKVVSDCEPVNSTTQFFPKCISSAGGQGPYVKGDGSVVVVQGVGGHEIDNVAINGSDPEIRYFDAVMGGNTNTQGALSGFGSVFYEVTADSIAVKTDFCPSGAVGSGGRCTSNPATVFQDRFSISVGGAPPRTSASFNLGPLATSKESDAIDPFQAIPSPRVAKD